MFKMFGRSFLTLKDFTYEEIIFLLDLASDLKEQKIIGKHKKYLENKNIALIFEKPSTRTRCAFAVACADCGAHSEYLGKTEIQLGHKESIEDTARVLGRMFDGIEFRGFSHRHVELLAKYSGVPVWNGLTDLDHPTQALADLMTIREHLGDIRSIKLVYVGDGRNNVANALMIAAAKTGMNFVICAPRELYPDQKLVNECTAFAKISGGTITISDNINSCAQNADVIYTDVWVSMGEEAQAAERLSLLTPYQVNNRVMKMAKKDALFMHCLPAVKGNEVTEDVFESDNSVVFDEAENRMHTIKAVMVATLCDDDKHFKF